MAKSRFFYKAAAVAAKSVLFGLVVTGMGLLIVSCAGSAPKISEAVRYAPSMDAVSGLNDKLLWILSHAESGGEYAVVLDSDEGGLTGGGNLSFPKKSGITGVTITIKSSGGHRTVSSTHFTIGSGITLILDNIILRGQDYSENSLSTNNSVVLVDRGGTFVMNEGSAVVGNTNNFGIEGGGVHVRAGGAFHMHGGTISGNKCIAGKQLITSTLMGQAMADALVGTASNKLSEQNNKASQAVGKVLGNALDSSMAHPRYPVAKGGGVYVSGLGIALFGQPDPPGIFVKTGGTITGHDSDPGNGNVVMDGGWPSSGKGSVPAPYTVSNTGGHAVYFGSSKGTGSKAVNTTMGPNECFEFRDGLYREAQCEAPKETAVAVAAAAPEEIPDAEEEVAEVVPAQAQEELPSSESEVETPLSAQTVQPADSAQEAEPAQAAAPAHAVAAPAQPAPPSAEEAPHAQLVEEVEIPSQQLRGEPYIAAYVFGAKDSAFSKAVAARLIVALMNSGRYQALEDYSEFFDQAVKEQKKGGHALLSAGQIKGLGERFGAEYVCVAEIAPVFGEYRVFAYIMKVKTAQIAAKGASDIPLKALADLTAASEQIVESMFKKAEKSQPPVAAAAPPAPPPPERSYGPPTQCPPCRETVREEAAVEAVPPGRRAKTGFTAGYGISGDARLMQLGGVRIQPISREVVSFAAEVNFRMGEWNSNFDGYFETVSYYGANVPLLFKFEKSVFFMETGVFADALSVKNGTAGDIWITDIGAVLGGGLAFNKGYTQYFYKFNYGMAYYSHVFGIRQLF